LRDLRFARIPLGEESSMTPNWNSALAYKYSIGDSIEDDDLMVNDALGTISPADSSGSDEEMETGDAKVLNFPTRED
jgi:hypothetical protein